MPMLYLRSCDIPGVIAAGWDNNVLEIKMEGRVLHTFHGVPESEYQAFLKTANPQEAIARLQEKYPRHSSNDVLG